MCQPSKTTGAVHHLTCMQNSSYLPSHMNTQYEYIHSHMFPLPDMHIHTHTHTHTHTYTHTSHICKNQTQLVSDQSPHQPISQQPNKWSRLVESHLHQHACTLVSVRPPYTHKRTCTQSRCLQYQQLAVRCATHSLIPALSLCLQHMRRQVLYLIHYSIDWLLAAALTLPCWSLGKRLAEGN